MNEAAVHRDVVIVGGGPAGIQAARLLKEHRPELTVAVLRPEPHSLIYCALPYAMEGIFPLERCFKNDDLVTGVGAELIRSRAVSLQPQTRTLQLEDGGTLSYEKLLVATGAVPIRPLVKGVGLQNVFTVKTAADTRAILQRLPAPQDCAEEEGLGAAPVKAVVIGSGAIGIEQATAYRRRGVEVHLVEMQDRILPHMLDADVSAKLSDALCKLGLHLHLSTRLERLEAADAGDEASVVQLSGGQRIALRPGRDFVVLAVGMKPDIALFAEAGLAYTTDGLTVDAEMRTSIPGIWAAGDCVAFHSGIDGKALGGKLATNAVPMAKVAVRNMLGLSGSYPGFFNGAATVVDEKRVGATGFTETYARSRGLEVFSTHASTRTRFPMMPGAGQIDVKLVFETPSGRLIGAQAVGDEAVAERIDLCTFAIQRGATAWELADFSYSAQPWQSFFPARNAIVEAASAARDQLERLRSE
ncbi:MAG: FAD-dependent oxidoreductase [Myxococcota bacterium]|nr:FAD-dependent oxidoreductase [Myxococcota bacterium]